MIVYLHGFASSSKSAKARFFADRLLEHGLPIRCPDFNQPAFASLTMTRMLAQLEREVDAVDEAAVTLVGSSLGGALAVLAAEKLGPRVSGLVLLAPAVMFAKAGHHVLPPERVAEWRRRGTLSFFHYGESTEQELDVAFYEDSLRYSPYDAVFSQPTLVFQGTHDASVDCHTVEQFARARRNVTLSLLDDDHQLIKSLPIIWRDVEAFLGLVD